MSDRVLELLNRLLRARDEADADAFAVIGAGLPDEEAGRIFEVYMSKIEECQQFIRDAVVRAQDPVMAPPSMWSLSDEQIRHLIGQIRAALPWWSTPESARSAMLELFTEGLSLLADRVKREALRDFLCRSIEILHVDPPENLAPARHRTIN